jgi:formylglycine-generating enzyme required for sulfatase activity/tRNA A-37 threonylcarbamoyl transferase component Bud32
MSFDLVNATLNGYKITRHLTNGAYAEIYLATSHTGASVVVKVLNPQLPKGGEISAEQALWHFRNESAALSALEHPHIVRLWEVGQETRMRRSPIHYIVCEYMSGGDLGAYCRRRGGLSLADVLRLFAPLCEALTLVHKKGLIHCDLKPPNLLLDDLTAPSLLKLSGFSVAKSASADLPVALTVVGTLPYAAPEHHPAAPEEAQGQPIDARADVYALAMTIAHALTGRRPELRNRTLDLTDLAPLFSGHEEQLASVMGRATAPRVQQRYASVADFWRDFEVLAQQTLDDDNATVVRSFNRMVIDFAPGSAPTAMRTYHLPLPEELSMEMVLLGGDEYTIGMTEEEAAQVLAGFPEYLRSYAEAWLSWSRPPRRVRLSPFSIGKYPVTQKQWRVVATRIEPIGRTLPEYPNVRHGRARARDDDLPVTLISWEEAVEFCARLSHRSKKACRLPSEAEWEYACRGGTTTPFSFAAPVTPRLVNYNGLIPDVANAEGWRLGAGPSAVGRVGGPNPFGLYDMHGNIWEWCTDTWHDSYDGLPQDGTAWFNRQDALRVVRGGSWRVFAALCRSASRARFHCRDRFDDIGFRIAI